MRGGTIMTTRGARAAACVVRVSVYELDADESNEREKVLRFRPPSRAQGWGGGGDRRRVYTGEELGTWSSIMTTAN